MSETAVQEEPKTRTRKTIKEQIAALDEKKANLASRDAFKTLAGAASGKRLVRALRGLQWIAAHPGESTEPIAAIAARTADSLAKELAKAYGIRPEHLKPTGDDDASSDETPPLPGFG